MRLAYHHGDPTSTANRLVSGDFLHFESLKRSRNAVLRDVVQGGGRGEVIKHTLRQPRWQMLRHIATVVVDTRVAALYAPACRKVDPNIEA